jgi:hypothetical protein
MNFTLSLRALPQNSSHCTKAMRVCSTVSARRRDPGRGAAGPQDGRRGPVVSGEGFSPRGKHEDQCRETRTAHRALRRASARRAAHRAPRCAPHIAPRTARQCSPTGSPGPRPATAAPPKTFKQDVRKGNSDHRVQGRGTASGGHAAARCVASRHPRATARARRAPGPAVPARGRGQLCRGRAHTRATCCCCPRAGLPPRPTARARP